MKSKMKNSKESRKNKSLGDCYNFYLEREGDEKLTEKQYKEINYLYFKFLTSKVLEGEGVSLPNRMGTLKILGRKPRIRFEKDEFGNKKIVGLAPNWKKTKELWSKNEEARKEKRMVYFTNEETGGVIYKWFWSKRNILVKNKTLYSLRMTRTNKRAVKPMIKKGKTYPLRIFKL